MNYKYAGVLWLTSAVLIFPGITGCRVTIQTTSSAANSPPVTLQPVDLDLTTADFPSGWSLVGSNVTTNQCALTFSDSSRTVVCTVAVSSSVASAQSSYSAQLNMVSGVAAPTSLALGDEAYQFEIVSSGRTTFTIIFRKENVVDTISEYVKLTGDAAEIIIADATELALKMEQKIP